MSIVMSPPPDSDDNPQCPWEQVCCNARFRVHDFLPATTAISPVNNLDYTTRMLHAQLRFEHKYS